MLQIIYKLDLFKFYEYKDYCPHQLPESCETYDILISRKTEVFMSGTSLGTAKLRKYLRTGFQTIIVKKDFFGNPAVSEIIKISLPTIWGLIIGLF
jgi:hypothetical protein